MGSRGSQTHHVPGVDNRDFAPRQEETQASRRIDHRPDADPGSVDASRGERPVPLQDVSAVDSLGCAARGEHPRSQRTRPLGEHLLEPGTVEIVAGNRGGEVDHRYPTGRSVSAAHGFDKTEESRWIDSTSADRRRHGRTAHTLVAQDCKQLGRHPPVVLALDGGGPGDLSQSGTRLT